MSSRPAGEGIVLALRRVVVGYRIVGLVWLWLLVAMTLRDSRDHWTLVIVAGLIATVWTAATVSAAGRMPALLRHPVWLATDVGVSGALIVLSSQVDPGSSFFGGYPFSTVLLAGFAAGYPGSFTAAVLLSAVSVIRLGGGEAINAVLVYLAGAGVVVWGFDVLRRNDAQRRALEQRLAAEEAERARSQERADTSAALHDSVLQTLALIQRRSDDPTAVAGLARRQERDLRSWLSGRDARLGATAATTFSAAISDAVTEVEEDYPLTVEAVAVGDAPLDERLAALVAAAREALVNVAKHAGVATASLYAEVTPAKTTVFVRDRGRGFDPQSVPPDRRGIAESIVGRLTRHGGSATVDSTPSGTEMELVIPTAPAEGGGLP